MTAWELPTSLEVGGTDYPINTDYRAVLDILKYYNDPNYDADEKQMICIGILYGGLQRIPPSLWGEALKKAFEFIDMGITDDSRRPKTMDWEQDAPLIIPAVNKVLGEEVRAKKYTHWWTFLGAYMGIGESLFSSVLNIRMKKIKKKKLEKHEQEFYRENKNLVDLKKKYSEEEIEEQKRLIAEFS